MAGAVMISPNEFRAEARRVGDDIANLRALMATTRNEHERIAIAGHIRQLEAEQIRLMTLADR
jgi:hypothetical protein